VRFEDKGACAYFPHTPPRLPYLKGGDVRLLGAFYTVTLYWNPFSFGIHLVLYNTEHCFQAINNVY